MGKKGKAVDASSGRIKKKTAKAGARSDKKSNQPKKKAAKKVAKKVILDDGDDESIDSDEAFNEEDYEMYGDVGGRKGGDSESGDEGDDEGLLLTEMIDDPDIDPRTLGLSGKTKKSKKENRKVLRAEESSDDEDDADVADGQLMENLRVASSKDEVQEAAPPMEYGPESEFNVGTLQESVGLEDLLAPLGDTPSFGEVRKQLQAIAKEEPLPEAQTEAKSARQERSLQYQNTAKDIKKWVPQIQRARRSDQVVLEGPEAIDDTKASTATLVSSFVATDDFEKELQEAVEEAGMTDKALSENGGLPVNKEIRDHQQTQQVAKLKALMLREQQRSKRVKKIKSKAFRKNQRTTERKEREKLLERLEIENPELAKTLKAEYEKKHAQLRLQRRNNARKKWAQAALRFGGHDGGMRQEITKQAQAQKDERDSLKKAIQGKNLDESDSEGVDLSGSDSEDDGKDGKKPLSVAKQTVRKAKKLTMEEIKGIDEDQLPQEGVFKMKFMQEAMKAKREAAKDQARSVLKDLESLEDAASDNSDTENKKSKSKQEAAAEDDANKRTFTTDELAQAHREVDEMIEREDEPIEFSVSGPLSVDSKKSVAALQLDDKISSLAGIVPGAIVKSVEEQAKQDPSNPWLAADQLDDIALNAGNNTDATKGKKSSLKKAKTAKRSEKSGKNIAKEPVEPASSPAKASKEAENPWLAADELENFSLEPIGVEDAGSAKKGTPMKVTTFSSNPLAEGKGVKKTKATKGSATKEEGSDSDDEDGLKFPEGGIFAALDREDSGLAAQREMVRTAFVGGSQQKDFEDEVELDEEEKKKQEEEKLQELPGWGSWAGEGIVPKKKRKPPPTKDDKASAKKPHVQVYKGQDKKASKYFVDKPVYPFQSAAQYEKTLRMPIGPEWNTLPAHLQKVKPKIVMKVGAIVPPLSYVKELPKETQEGVIECWGNKKRKDHRAKARM
eukprot:gnl/MRDRNA2_/MRDRNA2_95255_c0_seq1.p1 gnl/MRDRNA2_/MRDRNA2_95255_c0~~gnl/MRDRNA2_/MRDRNA2_95255_c0_seq1.p1  ORF type:complete len:958 (+),score=337.84 gnl/MRDRNA2_/MRDRNA2_95255_c0_seq1:76-2949(+)